MTAKRHALALLAGAAFIVSAAPPDIDTAPVPMFAQVDQIKQVMCLGSRGSAFQTGSGALTSVNHVTSDAGCSVDGVALQTVYADERLDFSQSRIAANGLQPLAVDCRGFQVGRLYVAAGYAHGLPVQRAVVVSPSANLIPTIQWENYTTLVGAERFIPGMSGSAVMDQETGAVVGIVKGYNSLPTISYALDVKLTPLCTGRA